MSTPSPTTDRPRPHDEAVSYVRACSSRHGAQLQLIVVHDTEGANLPGITDLQSLAAYFDASVGTGHDSSSHVATDAEGNSIRMVHDEDKAWHVAYYNPVSLGIEQVGYATQTGWPDEQLRETARWIAYWSHLHGVPVRKGRVTVDGRVTRTGVVRHSELGNLGGGHHDPGPSYPLATVLKYARAYKERL